MRAFHFLIAFTIVVSLGYSQCTGGLLNIPYTLASGMEDSSIHPTALRYARAAARATQGDTLMSIAPPIECSSTETESPAQTTKTQSSCRGGKSCLEQVVQSGAKHLATEEITGAGTQEILPAPILIAFAPTDGAGMIDLNAQSGPLYEKAALIAHITVKRE